MSSSPLFRDDSPLDVLIVGAGLSGIGTAVWLQNECPGKRYAILEARHSLGGTWDLFRYPGIRSDSDMYTLGYAFKPWTNPRAIADGPSIRQYIEEAANEYGIMPHIRFGHKVVGASWSSPDALWTVEVEDVATGVKQSIQARFLYMCSGYYSYEHPHRPTFAGEADFKGLIILPQFWPRDVSYANKRVVVIGSGATAMTLVPAMAQLAEHVTMVQRSPSYVVALPGEDTLAQRMRQLLPERLAYRLIRWKNVVQRVIVFWIARQWPKLAKKQLVQLVREELGPDYDVDRHFSPRYNPWDQRVCLVPDGDLFQAIRAGKASVVTDEIERFTADSLHLKSGEHVPADVVVMATGLTIQLFGGIALTVNGRTYQTSELMAYKGMMLSDIPNLAIAFGYTNASWTLKTDLTASYVCRLLRYMDRHGYATVVPRRQPHVEPRPFLDFTSGYVQRAAHLLPQQGSRRPWQVYQNYLKDLFTIRFGRLNDGVLHFGKKSD